ncbi:hypothetical protein LEMA_P045030.1 [Plenodomus lingam JN3]|uniref:Uncharacterized protein n=2 Tax=Leptosphaeria maculans TaxID=5022 RepID=E5R420_LEPMJ|nr:hypothetical protein LEMA_P045030.1 [Plenodomus lingam JN3]CBX91797.1 hypothetical protein LEMA_P045030.1 [Plenodomus lingam JN3]
MSSHEKLSAAANDRKARLAQLKSLKRKQAPTSDEADAAPSPPAHQAEISDAIVRTEEEGEAPSVATTYLSGRNYDPTTRNVKLGFDNLPIADPTNTLEYKAQQLALETKAQQEAENKEDNGLDLFKLQPKKPNWDLKRDLEQKMKSLDVQTENAIAKLVRERVEAQKVIRQKKPADGEGEEVGMEGSELVEAMHLKEQEEARDRRRDEEDEDGIYRAKVRIGTAFTLALHEAISDRGPCDILESVNIRSNPSVRSKTRWKSVARAWI